MKLKLIGLVFVIVALILIVVSVASLAMISVAREEYLFDNSTGMGYEIYYSRDVDAGHNYTIDVSVHQEAQWESTVNASVEIYIDGVSVFNTQLFAFDSTDDDEDRNTHAGDSVTFEFLTLEEVNLVVSGSLYEGDYWDISIYQDLPSSFADQTIQVMIMLLAGASLFFVGIIIFAKFRHAH